MRMEALAKMCSNCSPVAGEISPVAEDFKKLEGERDEAIRERDYVRLEKPNSAAAWQGQQQYFYGLIHSVEADRDEWKTGFNTERLLVASTEKLRVKAEAERDAAREALRELDQDLIGMGFRPKEGIRERVRRALEGA